MSDKKQFIKSIISGTICALIITVILISLLSFVILSTGFLPAEITKYILVTLLTIGTFWGAFIATKINKSAGLIVGSVTGFSVFMLVTLFGLIKSNEAVEVLTLIKLIATLISGALGGITGLKKSERIHIK